MKSSVASALPRRSPLGTLRTGFPAIVMYRNARARRQFFTLMRTRGAIPPPEPVVSESETALADYQAKLDERREEHWVATFDAGNDEPRPS